MQVIVSPVASGDNYLLPVSPDMAVSELRRIISEREHVQSNRIKLVAEGMELEDGATLADFYIANLSTVRLILTGPAPTTSGGLTTVDLTAHAAGGKTSGASGGDAAAAPSAASAGPSATPGSRPAAPSPDDTLVSDAEGARCVVVSAIPAADPIETEKALWDAFSRFGEMARVIIQDEGREASGTQRAVIVFHRESSAAAALAADGTVLLPGGAPCRVSLVSNIALHDTAHGDRATAFRAAPTAASHHEGHADAAGAAGAGAAGSERSGGHVTHRYFAPSASVSHLLAQGYLYGQQGVARVKRFGDEKGLTERVKVVTNTITAKAGELNQRYRIVPLVLETYEQAKASAADIDRELNISTRLRTASSYALAQAASWASMAMRNPTVAATVTSAQEFCTQAATALQTTLAEARSEVAQIDARVQGRPPQVAVAGDDAAGVALPPATAAGAPGGASSPGAGAPMQRSPDAAATAAASSPFPPAHI